MRLRRGKKVLLQAHALLQSKQLGTAKGGHAARNRDQAWLTWPWHDLWLAWDCHEQLLAACISALLVLWCGSVACSSLQPQLACRQHTVAHVGSAGTVCPVLAFSSARWGRFSTGDTSTWASFHPLRISLSSLREIFEHGPHQCWRPGSLASPRGQGKWQRGTKVAIPL